MNYLSQNDTDQSIKDSLTIAPRNDFNVQLSTLIVELDGVRQLMEGGGFNIVVGDFKPLDDVTVWVRADLPSDAPKFEHFIDLDILLAGILQTGVISEEVRNKGVHAERVKRSAKQSVVVTSFQRTFPEDWGSSNENNHFSNMKTFEQWNHGDSLNKYPCSIVLHV